MSSALKTWLSIAARARRSEQARPRGVTSAHSAGYVSEEKRSGRAAQPGWRRERLMDTSSVPVAAVRLGGGGGNGNRFVLAGGRPVQGRRALSGIADHPQRLDGDS